jgi:hypothetical protein
LAGFEVQMELVPTLSGLNVAILQIASFSLRTTSYGH